MELVTGEKILLESDNGTLTLTTHRVRNNRRRFWGVHITSIMLDEINSCEIRSTSNPMLLFLAALFAVSGVVANSMFIFRYRADYTSIILGVVAGLILAGVYYITRAQVIQISSGHVSIVVKTTGMKIDDVTKFIDSVEAAKNERYLAVKSKA